MPKNDVVWEIEVWFRKEVEAQSDLEGKLNVITTSHRERILDLKYKVYKKGISKFEISSYVIYEYVLEKKSNRKIEELEDISL